MVTIGSAFITGTTNWETLYAHEAAHMWWGDCVSIATWADFWLSEGFASYGDALWQEGGYGVEALRNRMRAFRNMYFAEDTGNRFPIYDPEVLLSSTVYEKGAWIVHMLRRVFDDAPAFFAMLQDYRAAYEHGNVTTAQFQAAAETGLGASLDWFFDQWVYMAGYPEYEYSWSWNAGTIILHIDQVQPVGGVTPLFTAEVDLRVATAAGDHFVTVLVDDESETFELEVPGRPITVEFDPDLWLLCKATEVNGPADLVFAAPGPDQGNRCVAALFDIDGDAAWPEIVPYGVDAWGANVACGDLDGDGIDELVTGPGPGEMFGCHVRAFDHDGGAGVTPISGISFFPYATEWFSYGVRVGLADVDGDGLADIITGPGPDPDAMGLVKVFSWTAGEVLVEVGGFDAFPDAIRGTSVAGGRFD